MRWYEKVLEERRKEIIASTSLAVIFTVCMALWGYFTGATYHWQTIEPVEAPGLLPRLFYSALVFVTIGALIYNLGFYKVLYSFFRGTRRGYRDYKEIKRLIWLFLILVMYFVIVPMVVSILNIVISFFYNIFILALYLFPPVAITASLFGGYCIAKRKF